MPGFSVAQTASYNDLVLLRGIDMVIYNAWDQRPKVGRKIFNVRESSQYREHTKTHGGLGLMQTKLEGTSFNYDVPPEGHLGTFTHVDYGLGSRVTRNMMRDELYGVMEDLGLELANSAAATEETLLASHFNNGFNSSYTGPDGLCLFNASHLREDGTTMSNVPSSLADLSKTSLEQGIIDFRTFVDGGGKKLAIPPGILLIPPNSQFTAARLLNSTMNPTVNYGGSGDSESAVNPLESLGLTIQVWDYLTDTDAWYLLARDKAHKLVMYDREEFNTDYIYDFDTRDYKISGLFSQSSGWGDIRGVYGSDGSAG